MQNFAADIPASSSEPVESHVSNDSLWQQLRSIDSVSAARIHPNDRRKVQRYIFLSHNQLVIVDVYFFINNKLILFWNVSVTRYSKTWRSSSLCDRAVTIQLVLHSNVQTLLLLIFCWGQYQLLMLSVRACGHIYCCASAMSSFIREAPSISQSVKFL